MTGKTINLLVLSGIHAGARTGLAKNEMKIGHGEGCDLIFSDQNIENIHCRIELEDEQILIYRQDGDVNLYGKSIDMAEVIVGTIFSIGDVQLAIVDDDTDINSLSVDKAPSLINSDTIDDPDDDPDDPDDPPMMSHEPTLGTEPHNYEEESEEEETADDTHPKKARGRSALIIASAVFVVVLGLLGWELFSVASASKNALERDPKAFHDYVANNYPDFVVEQIKSVNFTIQGTVATQAEKQAFIRNVREKFNFSYIWRIIVIEDIITDLKEQLGFYGANLSVSYVNGHINIRGYLADNTLLNELKAEVKRTTDIPTIWSIYGSKELEMAFAKNLKTLKIRSSHILRYQWSENRLTLVSYKNADQEKVNRALNAVAEKVGEDLNIPLWIDYKFIDRPTETAVVQTDKRQPLAVTASLNKKDITQVSTGAIPYVVLTNNERLFIGAETGGGFRITAIDSKRIVLSDGSTSRTVTLD